MIPFNDILLFALAALVLVVPIGAFDPKINNNNEIIFSEFTDMGYIISKQSLIANSENITFKITEPSEMDMYKTLANKSEGGNNLDKN